MFAPSHSESPIETPSLHHGSSPARPARLRDFASLALCIVAFLIPAISFLTKQSLWVDETTQMSGLALSPFAVVRWLAGGPPTFLVPADRMPPVSYWLGWLWSHAFRLSEPSMRSFGVTCAAFAVCAVWATARRAWGLTAATVAGLTFSLSPNLISIAPEIRAYPLLLLWSSLGFLCLMRLLENPRQCASTWLFGLYAFSILAMYTHFFGVLFTGAVFLPLGLSVLLHRGPFRKVLLAGGCVTLSAIGLVPLVKGALRVTGATVEKGPRVTALELGRFAYRSVIGHPALAGSTAIALLAIICLVILLSIALVSKRGDRTGVLALGLAVLAGSIVAIAAQFASSSISALSAQYNIWRLPALCLLVGSAFAVRNNRLRQVSRFCAIAVIAVSSCAASQFILHGDALSHTPSSRIASLINRLGPENVAIIHVDSNHPWGHIYYPLCYSYNGQLTQYLVDEKQQLLAPLPAGDNPIVPLDTLPNRFVMIVEARRSTNEETAAAIHGHPLPQHPSSAAVEALSTSKRWRQTETDEWPAMMAANIYVFERTESGSPGNAP